MPSKSHHPRPRLCTLEKGDNGYGFHLHGEKGKTGQFIRLVEPDSPAETSGLHAGDRLVFVNGEDVENESHQQVVSRIRATVGRLVLVVRNGGEIHVHVEKKLSINSEKRRHKRPHPECLCEAGRSARCFLLLSVGPSAHSADPGRFLSLLVVEDAPPPPPHPARAHVNIGLMRKRKAKRPQRVDLVGAVWDSSRQRSADRKRAAKVRRRTSTGDADASRSAS
ncbi:Na(+)/H(+) exchange regulatory cofactor NHE-RF1 [Liparis tanakae]|uniref:Na(+)/H(+) exchange regulatory cofactor NHE-RF1 n=1 Tax=Liparis tanakae TaxID=230148 RepID=A0A4Z2J0D6_9TELE|nr:Na(+)/H(+) exchange regulatory cofactor NHE-RF1 [Liparis tanakae]